MRRSPYREVGVPPVLRPTVDTRLQFDVSEWRTTALIDTGSPITVFDYGTAEALLVRFGHAGAETGTIALLGRRLRVQFETSTCRAAREVRGGVAEAGAHAT